MDENEDLDTPVEKCFSFTRVNTMRICHKWKIYNFSIINAGTGSKINSPVFSSSINKNIKWSLLLYPQGTTSLENYLGLFLDLQSVPIDHRPIKTIYQFSILDKNQNKFFVHKYASNFTEPQNRGTNTFVLRSDIMNDTYLPNDCLTIQCDMVVGLNNNYKASESIVFDDITTDEKCHLKLLNNYKTFLNSPNLSDVTIIISDRRLQAHKLILSAHSPVFLAMFKNGMKENQDNAIKITDIKYEVFQELLRFIYTGKIENIDIVANDLLVAADKYVISELLIMCEQYLQSNLSLDNVIDMLVLADNHNANNLRQSAIKLFTADKKVADTKNFDFIDKLKPDTVGEILKLAMNTA